jgi:hypothetical protein
MGIDIQSATPSRRAALIEHPETTSADVCEPPAGVNLRPGELRVRSVVGQRI